MNIKHLKEQMTNRQKAIPRFVSNILKCKGINRSINWFRYDWNVLSNEHRNFTAPVLAATITNKCNLRCPTCLYSLGGDKFFGNNFMDRDDFREVLKKHGRKAEIIFLTGGEPLRHPYFGDFIDIAKDYGLKVKTSTNGILINANSEAIKKLDDINVSLDAWDHNSFKKYRGGSEEQWGDIVSGIFCLKKNNINFSLSFLLSRENAKSVECMLATARALKPTTVHLHNINPHDSMDVLPLTVHCKELSFIKEVTERTDYNFDIVISHIFDESTNEFWSRGCVQPWYYLCWDSMGNISPCCHLNHDPYYGNIFHAGEDKKLISFRRKYMMSFPVYSLVSCRFCHRRFLGKNYAIFDSRRKRWNF